MSDITLRHFEERDVDEIVELSLQAWAPVFASFAAVMGTELYRRVHPDWHRDQAAAVRQALEDNETWIAEADGRVAGFVNVAFDQPERSGEIYMIAVDPRVQRRGIASLLTERALDEMRVRGIDLAIVATGGDPGHAPARATYVKAGFTPVPQVWYSKLIR
jgi:ribosomal protein S18 acetylase RimI-like enzyme